MTRAPHHPSLQPACALFDNGVCFPSVGSLYVDTNGAGFVTIYDGHAMWGHLSPEAARHLAKLLTAAADKAEAAE